ncbi:hypothetical protein QJQ45_013978 [Haematococcus lacustris]|nr:hypothetical protein QJQ45_013978 [Haematococcus lacustris]
MATLDELIKKVQEEIDDVKDNITRIEALPEGDPERQRLVELDWLKNYLREEENLLLRGAIGASTNNPFQSSAPSYLCPYLMVSLRVLGMLQELYFTSFHQCLRTRWLQHPRTSVYDVQVLGRSLRSVVRMT